MVPALAAPTPASPRPPPPRNRVLGNADPPPPPRPGRGTAVAPGALGPSSRAPLPATRSPLFRRAPVFLHQGCSRRPGPERGCGPHSCGAPGSLYLGISPGVGEGSPGEAGGWEGGRRENLATHPSAESSGGPQMRRHRCGANIQKKRKVC